MTEKHTAKGEEVPAPVLRLERKFLGKRTISDVVMSLIRAHT